LKKWRGVLKIAEIARHRDHRKKAKLIAETQSNGGRAKSYQPTLEGITASDWVRGENQCCGKGLQF
jgi:hypothetical protein